MVCDANISYKWIKWVDSRSNPNELRPRSERSRPRPQMTAPFRWSVRGDFCNNSTIDIREFLLLLSAPPCSDWMLLRCIEINIRFCHIWNHRWPTTKVLKLIVTCCLLGQIGQSSKSIFQTNISASTAVAPFERSISSEEETDLIAQFQCCYCACVILQYTRACTHCWHWCHALVKSMVYFQQLALLGACTRSI